MTKNELKRIAGIIASKVNVDKIYCFSGEEGVRHNHLILLVPTNSGYKFTEIEPFVKMAIAGESDLTFTLFHTSEVINALRAGNLGFYLICLNDNLLYNKENQPPLWQPTNEQLTAWKIEANERFNDGINKTNSFLEGAYFYNDKDERNLTVFMLHQVAELTYRALELFILDKEKRTHNIAEHQKFIKPFLPQLVNLFPADTAEEVAIIKALNDAYLAVRYEHKHLVNADFVPVFFERIKLLQDNIISVVSGLNNTLDNIIGSLPTQTTLNNQYFEASPTLVSEKFNFVIGAELKEVLSLIVVLLSPVQVYLFGNELLYSERANLFALDQNCDRRKLHFDLLIISSIPNPYINLHTQVNKNIDKVTLNLLVHTPEEVVKRLQEVKDENRNRFFETVFRDGLPLYSKREIFDRSAILPDNHLIHSHAATYCKRRFQRAEAFLNAAINITGDTHEVVLSLLSQSIEQVCLGLIYAFWGYIPNHQSISHLLGICQSFFPNGAMYLRQKTDSHKYLISLLSGAFSSVRYSVGEPINQDHFDTIRLKSIGFIEHAINEGLKEVEVLAYHPINAAQDVKFKLMI